jgi:hypothetical protein
VTEHYAVPALRAALEILERYPPIGVRGQDRSHSGEHDCAACDYPLTGPGPNAGTHENWRQPSWRSGRGEPCHYLGAMQMIRNTLDLFVLDAEGESDEEVA